MPREDGKCIQELAGKSERDIDVNITTMIRVMFI
jgi:hypothetical protein